MSKQTLVNISRSDRCRRKRDVRDVVSASPDGIPLREVDALRRRLPRIARRHLHPDRHLRISSRQHKRYLDR